MHVNHLEFSNSEAEDNFEILRVCMGKRNLDEVALLPSASTGRWSGSTTITIDSCSCIKFLNNPQNFKRHLKSTDILVTFA